MGPERIAGDEGGELACGIGEVRRDQPAYAAWRVGVTVFDAAIGGIGGCPFAPTATGNIATKDMAYMFERMGVRSGLDLQSVIETGRWVGERLGYAALPGMVGRAGVFPPVH